MPPELQQLFNCDPLYMSMPVRVNKNGIKLENDFECSDQELMGLRESAKTISNYL
jgi:malate/lactate dehydrogenase